MFLFHHVEDKIAHGKIFSRQLFECKYFLAVASAEETVIIKNITHSKGVSMFTARSAMSHLGFPDLIQQQILSLYNLPYRHYHNETHLDNMLRWVDPKYGKLNAVLEGVIFHDIVHMNRTTPPGFNESASIAIYASMKNNILGDDFSLDKILDTVEAINATAYHQNDQSGLCDVAQILCDLDMQSFASAEHGTDAENVLKEYMAHGYTYEEVLDGNRKFLEKLLNRKRLYYVFTDWEERARANISARIYSAKHDRLSA